MTATVFSTAIGTRTSLTMSLNSLTSANYVASSALDLHNIVGGATAPVDVIVEFEITPGTVSGNKQVKMLASISMDGSNYSSGPTSGSTTTDEPDLYYIGAVPVNTDSTLQRVGFSLLQALGFIPYSVKIIAFNDSGAALAGSGNACYYTVITGDGR